MNDKPLVKARKVLEPFWRGAWLKGRCWGPVNVYKDPHFNNPFACSNITIAIDNELVSVSQDPDGSLRVHEFRRMSNETKLGESIKEALKEKGLKVKEVGMSDLSY